MVICNYLPCAITFVNTLDEALCSVNPKHGLTAIQRLWLCTVLIGIIVTETLCWAAFERRGLNAFTQGQLRWMFKNAQLAWSQLLQCSVMAILKHYGLQAGALLLDDSNKRRAKQTTRIFLAGKIKDTKTGGFINGQEVVFMLLVTDIATFPVDFRFYAPDPDVSAANKTRKEQKKQGVPAAQRESIPVSAPKYRKKHELALDMLEAFAHRFPTFHIRGVLADALYGNKAFMDKAAAVTRGAQVVSQLRANQMVLSDGKYVSLKTYFAQRTGVETKIRIRGQAESPAVMAAACLRIKAHGKRRLVVALRYDGETDYRFLVATDMSWRHIDVVQIYTLRWLIEVFFEDWKAHGGWNKLTKHQGEDGSTRSLILSLLSDHMLLLHPEQSARLKNKQPGLTAGCLVERIKTEALVATVEGIVYAKDPFAAFGLFVDALRDALPDRESGKHMVSRDLGRQEPPFHCSIVLPDDWATRIKPTRAMQKGAFLH